MNFFYIVRIRVLRQVIGYLNVVRVMSIEMNRPAVLLSVLEAALSLVAARRPFSANSGPAFDRTAAAQRYV